MKEILPKVEGELPESTKESVRLIQTEIEKIKSEDIKEFTYQAFMEVNAEFWTTPASSSGKYHPVEDNGEGGLVRHVVKSSVVLEQELREMGATERELDLGRSAVLLHDVCKKGINWEAEGTDYTHGYLASVWLEKFNLADEAAKKEILSAVRYHMGQWSYAVSPFENRSYTKDEMLANLSEVSRALHPSRIEKAVQVADYYASRQSMSFFPGVSADFRKKTEE